LALADFFDLSSGGEAGGASPSTPLSGQILKAGHFWQPATTAIGQSVMGIPQLQNCIVSLFVRRK
jgi:hypothetical protein